MMKRCYVTGMETGSCYIKTSRVTSSNGDVTEAAGTDTETANNMSLNALRKCFTLAGPNTLNVFFLPNHLRRNCQNKLFNQDDRSQRLCNV